MGEYIEINKIDVLIVAVLILFLGVGIANAIGFWDTDTETHEHNGDTDSLIKGRMSLDEVVSISGIKIHHFIEDFNLPSDVDTTIPLSEISDTYGIDFHVSEVKDYVENFEHGCGGEHEEDNDVDCPFGEVDDPAPGKCGVYTDEDGNDICDLSE